MDRRLQIIYRLGVAATWAVSFFWTFVVLFALAIMSHWETAGKKWLLLVIAELVLVVVAGLLFRWVDGQKKHMGKLGTTAFVVVLFPSWIYSSFFFWKMLYTFSHPSMFWLDLFAFNAEAILYYFLGVPIWLVSLFGVVIFIFSWLQLLRRWMLGQKNKPKGT